MQYFLLMYDRRRGKILGHIPFPYEERDRALAERARRVQEARENPDLEIVLLGANSYDDLRKTHSRYFKTAGQLAKQKRPRDRVLTG